MTPASPAPALDAAEAPPERGRALPAGLRPSAWACLAAGALTPFTFVFVGKMPLGEAVLAAAAGAAALGAVLSRARPGPLFGRPLLGALFAAQAVALAAYVFSDLYRGSAVSDMERGWSRLLFLGVDILAVAYLFGRAPRNWVVLTLALAGGQIAEAAVDGPLFGDWWKFGLAEPVVCAGLLAGALAGPWAAAAAAAGLGVLNFEQNYRNLGAVCLAVAALTVVQAAPRRARAWIAPLALAAGLGAGIAVHAATQEADAHASRSDIERSAMVAAAWEAFERSPLVGSGSWFSNSRVYDDFMEIRHVKARQAHVGGFADANGDPGDAALHSQILVTLAEGGIFGAAFFVVYGVALARAIVRMVLWERWRRLAPLRLLLLLVAAWNLGFSPFSGAHRVYIALACGLLLLSEQERSGEEAIA